MTAIEWTDATWNPTTGCDRISPGCDHCYALTLAARLKRNVPGSDEKEEVARLREQVHGAVEALRAIVAEPNPGGAVAADAMRMIAQTQLRRLGGQQG